MKWVRGATTATITKSSTLCRYRKAGLCTRRPCRFLHGEPLNPIAARPTPKSIAPTPTIAKRNKVWKREDSENLLKTPASPPKDGTKKTIQESSNLDAELPALVPGEVLEMKETENITKTLGSPARKGRKRKSSEICNLDDVVCRGFITGTCNDGENCSNRHAYCISDGFSDLGCLEGHSDAVTGIALLSGTNKLFSGSKDKTVKIWDCGTGKCAQVVNVEGEVGCIKSVGAWVFAGIPNVVKDGSISAWKPTADGKSFLLAATLGGHKKSAVSLILCATKLYSGSMDCTIRGVLALCGMHDDQDRPVQLYSCTDNRVHAVNLPSNKGRIYSKEEVKVIQIGPHGLFFTGDGAGELKV